MQKTGRFKERPPQGGTLGARPVHTLIVGCEPAFIISDENPVDIHMGLSQPVQAAVDEAVKMLDSLVERLLTSAPVS